MLILEDLYTGHVVPYEQHVKHGSQHAKASAELSDAEDALIATLSAEQKELFDAFLECQHEVAILTDCETFIHAFRLGAMIMLDVMTEGEMNEI